MATQEQPRIVPSTVSGNLKMIDDASLQRLQEHHENVGAIKFKAKLLLELEKLENGVVDKISNTQSGHNKDVEAGKRKGIRMAKKLVSDTNV